MNISRDELSPAERQRYSRMIVLRDFGKEGQLKVRKSTVTVVGAGGLGSPALRMLAAIGFKNIRIVDSDIVDLSNMQRQTLYTMDDLGKPKAEAAASNLREMNPDVTYEPISIRISDSNSIEVLKGSDVIVDGLDTFLARRVVNRASVSLRIPYIFAGAIEYMGNVTTFVPGETGCLDCFAPSAQDDPSRSCANVGVSPELLSVVAGIEVREAVRIAIGKEPLLKNRLLSIDMETLDFDSFEIGRNLNCATCSRVSTESIVKTDSRSVTTLCSGSFNVSPTIINQLNLSQLAERLSTKYDVKVMGDWLRVRRADRATLTLMKQGTAVVKGVSSQEEALSFYDDVVNE